MLIGASLLGSTSGKKSGERSKDHGAKASLGAQIAPIMFCTSKSGTQRASVHLDPFK